MGTGLEVAAWAAVAVAATSSTYSAIESNQQRQDAKGAANEQKDLQKQREADLQAQKDRDLLKGAQIARHRAAVGMGRTGAMYPGGTILTSPIGTTGTPTSGTKTLLGQ